jgi:hypothetical protein
MKYFYQTKIQYLLAQTKSGRTKISAYLICQVQYNFKTLYLLLMIREMLLGIQEQENVKNFMFLRLMRKNIFLYIRHFNAAVANCISKITGTAWLNLWNRYTWSAETTRYRYQNMADYWKRRGFRSFRVRYFSQTPYSLQKRYARLRPLRHYLSLLSAWNRQAVPVKRWQAHTAVTRYYDRLPFSCLPARHAYLRNTSKRVRCSNTIVKSNTLFREKISPVGVYRLDIDVNVVAVLASLGNQLDILKCFYQRPRGNQSSDYVNNQKLAAEVYQRSVAERHVYSAKPKSTLKTHLRRVGHHPRQLRWQAALFRQLDDYNREMAKRFPINVPSFSSDILLERFYETKAHAQRELLFASRYLAIINANNLPLHFKLSTSYADDDFIVYDHLFVAEFLYVRLMYYGEKTASQLGVLSMLQYLKHFICQNLVHFIENFLVTGFPVYFELVRVKHSNREHDLPAPLRMQSFRSFMLKKFITKFRRRHNVAGFFSAFVSEILTWQLDPALSFLFQYFEDYYNIGMDTRFLAHYRWDS